MLQPSKALPAIWRKNVQRVPSMAYSTEFGLRLYTMTGITRVKFLSFFSLLSAPLSVKDIIYQLIGAG